MNKLGEITVSVVMITYNHEAFISKAVNSVINQSGNFNIEFIISNDASTDQTNNIIETLIHRKYSNITFRYYNHKTNLGVMRNFMFALNKATGDYLAICEGDDFWCNSDKLKIQLNFLENNPDYIIHSGAAKKVTESGDFKGFIGNYGIDSIFELDDFYCKNNLVSCTTLFRNTKIDFPKSFNNIKFGDWFLYVILLNQSNKLAYRSKEVLSAYTINSQGIMSSIKNDAIFEENLKQMLALKKYLGYSNFKLKHVIKLNFTVKQLVPYYLTRFEFFNVILLIKRYFILRFL